MKTIKLGETVYRIKCNLVPIPVPCPVCLGQIPEDAGLCCKHCHGKQIHAHFNIWQVVKKFKVEAIYQDKYRTSALDCGLHASNLGFRDGRYGDIYLPTDYNIEFLFKTKKAAIAECKRRNKKVIHPKHYEKYLPISDKYLIGYDKNRDEYPVDYDDGTYI
jgi:hypothetical protein